MGGYRPIAGWAGLFAVAMLGLACRETNPQWLGPASQMLGTDGTGVASTSETITASGCDGGLAACGPDCVDVQTNAAHCGGCDRACPVDATCVGGACECPAGRELCGDVCADTQTDAAHCGACGTTCDAGSVCCGGGCVDVMTNGDHCGMCDRPCGAATCESGSCECQGNRLWCDLMCINPNVDEAHCGVCFNPCAMGQMCTGGTCG